jgi:hypothetical protein
VVTGEALIPAIASIKEAREQGMEFNKAIVMVPLLQQMILPLLVKRLPYKKAYSEYVASNPFGYLIKTKAASIYVR